MLAKEGVDLQVKVFNDFIQPNQQLAEKHPRRQLLPVPAIPR
ncbi:MetQ/NlpA family ABC transporter substrate-binding protein [Klebsiella variicola subsp. variicola]|nr:MetQ/NlpA family ABC transporter substrate-binding protein [Klebsiella variicola subsp. variicola]